MLARFLFHRLAPGDISWHRDYGDAAPGQGCLHRDLENARHLFRVRNQFTVVTALREEMFWMCLLKISAADFRTWDLRGNGQNRNTAPVTIIKTVNQMEIARSATPGAHGQASGQMRFRAGGKRSGFFMSHMNPSNFFLPSNRLGNGIERVTRDPVDSFHPRSGESFQK